jgi:hypothetical protein
MKVGERDLLIDPEHASARGTAFFRTGDCDRAISDY